MAYIKEIVIEPNTLIVGSAFKIKVKTRRYLTYEEIKDKTVKELKNYTVNQLKGVE